MATVYKVWIIIEAYDTETETGEELDAPGAALSTHDTAEEAWRAAKVADGAARAALDQG